LNGNRKERGRQFTFESFGVDCRIRGFSVYITCPRMTAMIATKTKINVSSPFLMVSLGCIFGIPLFIALFYTLQSFGIEATVLSGSSVGCWGGATSLQNRFKGRNRADRNHSLCICRYESSSINGKSGSLRLRVKHSEVRSSKIFQL